MGQNILTGGRAWGKILGRCEVYTGVKTSLQEGLRRGKLFIRFRWLFDHSSGSNRCIIMSFIQNRDKISRDHTVKVSGFHKFCIKSLGVSKVRPRDATLWKLRIL